jgi:hypothetical protein
MLTKTHATTWIRCGMCDTAATVEHAVETGWVPYCYADRVEIRNPPLPGHRRAAGHPRLSRHGPRHHAHRQGKLRMGAGSLRRR